MGKSVGDRVSSPNFISGVRSEVISAFSRAASRGPIQGLDGKLNCIAMDNAQWVLLNADLDSQLERMISDVLDVVERQVDDLVRDRNAADRHAGVLSRRLAELENSRRND